MTVVSASSSTVVSRSSMAGESNRRGRRAGASPGSGRSEPSIPDGSVFISYRRGDSAGHTGRLYDGPERCVRRRRDLRGHRRDRPRRRSLPTDPRGTGDLPCRAGRDRTAVDQRVRGRRQPPPGRSNGLPADGDRGVDPARRRPGDPRPRRRADMPTREELPEPLRPSRRARPSSSRRPVQLRRRSPGGCDQAGARPRERPRPQTRRTSRDPRPHRRSRLPMRPRRPRSRSSRTAPTAAAATCTRCPSTTARPTV